MLEAGSYRSSPTLCTSDHSPVGAIFRMPVMRRGSVMETWKWAPVAHRLLNRVIMDMFFPEFSSSMLTRRTIWTGRAERERGIDSC